VFLLFLLAILGLVWLYTVPQRARRRRILRFANMELLKSVAPIAQRGGDTCPPSWW
jgi:Ca-activated chloride channel family protein